MIEKKYFAITIKYQGTRFLGWQIQPQTPTVQQEIETVLERLTGRQVRIFGAGRTDAGVHALEQIANFSVVTRLDCAALYKGLNALLPDDIVVIQVQECDPSFHARFSAIGKYYLYAVHMSDIPSLWTRHFSLHVRHKVDIGLMQSAARLFIGTHNFSNFCANSGRENEVFQRTIYDFRIEHTPPFVFFHVLGKSFLYKMVRLMVGTLIEIGRNKNNSDIITRALTSTDRIVPAPVAPAHGLTLRKIFYEPPVEIPYLDNSCNLFLYFDVLNSEKDGI
ncbi:MAG: tRNA pseudouridine(38-40) synthase TruA [Candidatus Auribacterota bacterium]|jgi:tRNA pseudouridine38-40 synthase|nr:tRNA pseudouridine(38-40) synthase TruA [Candidatus Auribacterota bacterium]